MLHYHNASKQDSSVLMKGHLNRSMEQNRDFRNR